MTLKCFLNVKSMCLLIFFQLWLSFGNCFAIESCCVSCAISYCNIMLGRVISCHVEYCCVMLCNVVSCLQDQVHGGHERLPRHTRQPVQLAECERQDDDGLRTDLVRLPHGSESGAASAGERWRYG